MTTQAQTPMNGIPSAALVLGAAGLIPFVACATEIIAGRKLLLAGPGPALYALQIYGAVILSFLGGAQWGLAVAASSSDWRRYGLSVLPSLVAWCGVWFTGRNGLLVLLVGFAALLAYDYFSVTRGEAPRWYGNLRALLSAGVIASLAMAALFGPF